MSVAGSPWLVAFAIVALAVFASPRPAQAVPIGIVSFDPFIPGPDGVNRFDVHNLTGDFALPPDFGVTGALTFMDATLSLIRDGGATEVFELGDVGPGTLGDPTLLVPELDAFVSATFAATLSSQTFLMADGTTRFAPSAAILVTLLPSFGELLLPGDFVVIDVDANPQSIPEPPTLALVGTGLAGLWVASRRRR